MTDSGKSTLARELFLTTAAPRLVIDPADSHLTNRPGVETFRDPHRIPDAATTRFVPSDPQDRDIYDALYARIWRSFPRFVWLDEAGVAAPAQGAPRWVRTVVIQGRKRQLGHLTCHTRPVEVERNLIAQAAHVFVFTLPNPADRRYVAELVGLRPAQFDQVLDGLGDHEFIWYRVRERRLIVCPAIDARRAHR